MAAGPWDIAAAGASAIGGALGAGGDRRQLTEDEKAMQFYRRKAMEFARTKLPELHEQMMKPFDFSQIAQFLPLISKAMAPYIRKVGRSSAAKFGLRSPMTASRITGAATQALAGPAGNLASAGIQNQWRNMQQAFSTYGGLLN